MNFTHLKTISKLSICALLSFLLQVTFAQIPAGQSIQIPAGVHYEAATEALNASAKELLTKSLHSPSAPQPDFFNSVLTCGPGLWKLLAPSADKSLLDAKKVVNVVNKVQMESRGFITEAQQQSFWKLLLTHYPNLAYATIRKAHPDEINYYWATIPFNIEEPFFAIDDGKEVFIANFNVTNGTPKLFWIDLVTDLKKLTAGPPKIIDLDLATTMAESGDIPTMVFLGKAYLNGGGVPADPVKALDWFHRAADKGSFEAEMMLGSAYMSGYKVPKDPALAVKFLTLAANHKNIDPTEKSSQALAQYFLYSIYEKGVGVEKSHDQAMQYLKASVENGNPPAQFALGMLLYNGEGGLNANKPEACQLFLKAADQGQVRAMHNIAYCYQTGEGETVKQDIMLAQFYYLKAAEAGYVSSQHNLGLLYGQMGDSAKSYFWLRISQLSGNTEKPEDIDVAKSHLTPSQISDEDQQITAWTISHHVK